MSKITFRADDNLVEQLEGIKQSKSEVMREALRAYLENRKAGYENKSETVNDEIGSEFLSPDERSAQSADHPMTESKNHTAQSIDREVTVNIVLDGEPEAVYTDRQEGTAAEPTEELDIAVETEADRKTSHSEETSKCNKCGKVITDSQVYCPNCGEKATHRAFCECGDEIQSDWAFCPSCGRRTSAADVLESS
ncbi:zinc ribbon domain-containing protein [Haloquadratum walsbyi]|jgi:hypothetical protein|uniref:Transcriptional regulator, CopG family protein n=1 Tax=Haloquadratum walsbyi J07HQW2 TaxID=1238425 RepID=U1N0B8_9EURY|nr:zinc ribbon domain-containing protein [Haloquadratum walsbyi]ERG96239.1 MAG: transcriptional regulator, CopG family protein [Haloquadratum walsbyi J07HQW2]